MPLFLGWGGGDDNVPCSFTWQSRVGVGAQLASRRAFSRRSTVVFFLRPHDMRSEKWQQVGATSIIPPRVEMCFFFWGMLSYLHALCILCGCFFENDLMMCQIDGHCPLSRVADFFDRFALKIFLDGILRTKMYNMFLYFFDLLHYFIYFDQLLIWFFRFFCFFSLSKFRIFKMQIYIYICLS